jgi:hypothetical protein
MGGHPFECALLVRQQDLGWQCLWIGKERVSGLGRLPISAGLIDRSLRLGAKRFGERERAPLVRRKVNERPRRDAAAFNRLRAV